MKNLMEFEPVRSDSANHYTIVHPKAKTQYE